MTTFPFLTAMILSILIRLWCSHIQQRFLVTCNCFKALLTEAMFVGVWFYTTGGGIKIEWLIHALPNWYKYSGGVSYCSSTCTMLEYIEESLILQIFYIFMKLWWYLNCFFMFLAFNSSLYSGFSFVQILLDSCITIPKETLVLRDDPVTGYLAKTIGSRTPEGYFTLWD